MNLLSTDESSSQAAGTATAGKAGAVSVAAPPGAESADPARPAQSGDGTTGPASPDPADKPTVELLKDLSNQLTTLFHQEVELAKAEVREKAKSTGEGVGLFGAAGLSAFFGVAALVTAAIAALSLVLSIWASALIVFGVLAGIAGVLALMGRSVVSRSAAPLPTGAIEQSKEDVAWLRRQAKSVKP